MPLNAIEYVTSKISEEAGELVQACGKANIFGILSLDPYKNQYALDRLMNEWWDLFGNMVLLKQELESCGVKVPNLFNPDAVRARIKKTIDAIPSCIENGSFLPMNSDQSTVIPINSQYRADDSVLHGDQFLAEFFQALDNFNNENQLPFKNEGV